MNEIVSLKHVTKSFQHKKAVSNVSFSIGKGEVVAILGPNGAGKTTAISMILGLLKPTEGEVTLFHKDPQEKYVRERIGAMLQEVSVVPGLSVNEILQLIQSYYPHPLSLLELTNLTGLTKQDLKTRAEKLSGGQKRRLSFALALAGNPELILFDEPTVGMDIESRRRFWNTVNFLADQGKTVLFSTHYLQEADDAARRILFFNEGCLVADGTPKQIKSKITKQAVSFLVDSEESLDRLYQHKEVGQIVRDKNRIFVQTNHSDRVLELIFQEKMGAYDIQIENGKLEEAFEQLISGNKEGK